MLPESLQPVPSLPSRHLGVTGPARLARWCAESFSSSRWKFFYLRDESFFSGMKNILRSAESFSTRPAPASAEACRAMVHPPFFGFFFYYWVTDSTRHHFLLFSDLSTPGYACLRPWAAKCRHDI